MVGEPSAALITGRTGRLAFLNKSPRSCIVHLELLSGSRRNYIHWECVCVCERERDVCTCTTKAEMFSWCV